MIVNSKKNQLRHKPWNYHHASAPLLTAGTVYGAGELLNYAHTSVLYPSIVGTLAASTIGLTEYGSGSSVPTIVYSTSVTAAAAGWLTASAMVPNFPFTMAGVLSALAATAVFGPLYRAVRYHRANTEDREAIRVGREKWVHAFRSIGLAGVEIPRGGIESNRAGFTLHVLLPPGMTLSTIQSASDKLEVALSRVMPSVRRGSISVTGGAGAHEVLITVGTADILSETVPLPDDHSALSIRNPLPFATYETGGDASIAWYEDGWGGKSGLVVGKRGSGKSVTVNVLLAQLLRCPDVVVFGIDLKGGRTLRPWLTPWQEGWTVEDANAEGGTMRAEYPVLDWVATTLEEAVLLLETVVAMLDYRATAGTGSMVVPTPNEPAIIVLCEEIADLTAAATTGTGDERKLGGRANRAITRIMKKGRSEAINDVLVTQRATVVNTAGGEAKSQIDVTIGLRTEKAQDTLSVFPDDAHIKLHELEHSGTLYVKDGADAEPRKARSWYVADRKPEVIAQLAADRTQWRSELDAGTAAAGGDAYANRWSPERAGHLLGAAQRATANAGASPASSSTSGTDAKPAGGFRLRLNMPKSAPKPTGGLSDEEFAKRTSDEAFADLMKGAGAGDLLGLSDAESNGDGVSESRRYMRQLIAAAGPDGMAPVAILRELTEAGKGAARQTVQRWLKEDVDAGILRKLDGADAKYTTGPNYRP